VSSTGSAFGSSASPFGAPALSGLFAGGTATSTSGGSLEPASGSSGSLFGGGGFGGGFLKAGGNPFGASPVGGRTVEETSCGSNSCAGATLGVPASSSTTLPNVFGTGSRGGERTSPSKSAVTASAAEARAKAALGLEPPPVPIDVRLSPEEHKEVKDLFQIWDKRLREQSSQFESYTVTARKAEGEISGSMKNVRDIRSEQRQITAKQEAVDRSMSLVIQQQDAVSKLLLGLTETLNLKLPSGGSFGVATKGDRRAEAVLGQLDELDQQVVNLTTEIDQFRTSRYTEPLERATNALDAHSCALDQLEEHLRAAERRLAAAERCL